MVLSEIVRIVGGTLLTKHPAMETEIPYCGASDLMSDVLAHIRPKALLVTGLINPHCIRTAEMTDVSAILFVRGKRPGEDVIALAEELGIPLISTPCSMYQACGLLFQSGLKSVM